MKTNGTGQSHVAASRQSAAFSAQNADGGALPRRRYDTDAFCRLELVAVIAALVLIVLVALPSLANTRYSSDRALCANNLRLVGRALHSWLGDHGNNLLPWRTLVSAGGTMPDSGSKPGIAWFEWAFLSNYLGTPKILACPADEPVVPTSSFEQFVQAHFRANSVSYTVFLDAYTEIAQAGVSTDRNVRVDGQGSCSSRVAICETVAAMSLQAGWTNGAVHGEFGHVLFTDSSVEFTSLARFRVLTRTLDDNGSIHFLRAR